MIPVWLVWLVFLLGIGIGWVGRTRFDAEVRLDEQIVDEALKRSWQAGWRARERK